MHELRSRIVGYCIVLCCVKKKVLELFDFFFSTSRWCCIVYMYNFHFKDKRTQVENINKALLCHSVRFYVHTYIGMVDI